MHIVVERPNETCKPATSRIENENIFSGIVKLSQHHRAMSDLDTESLRWKEAKT